MGWRGERKFHEKVREPSSLRRPNHQTKPREYGNDFFILLSYAEVISRNCFYLLNRGWWSIRITVPGYILTLSSGLRSVISVPKTVTPKNLNFLRRILILYLKQCRRPWCVFKMPHLRDMASQTPMDTAALIAYKRSPIYGCPGRIWKEEWDQWQGYQVVAILPGGKRWPRFGVSEKQDISVVLVC